MGPTVAGSGAPRQSARMGHRVMRSGSFSLPTTAERAMPLFTAEGERAWAPGWDPVFACDPHPDEPGQVWTTHAHGVTTTWVTTARTATSATYARVTPGHSAGTVSVSIADTSSGCEVTTTYDLTSLGDDLAHLEHGFDEMLLEWQRLTTPLVVDLPEG